MLVGMSFVVLRQQAAGMVRISLTRWTLSSTERAALLIAHGECDSHKDDGCKSPGKGRKGTIPSSHNALWFSPMCIFTVISNLFDH